MLTQLDKIEGNKISRSVAIIIPCRNESKYIGRCLNSLLENDFDKRSLEILVVDGMSSDGTREIVGGYTKKYPFIRLLNNPQIIKPVALNLGIQATQSDVVMRIDAHAVYEKNYISTLVAGLYKYKADNIGGVRETWHGKTPKEMAIVYGISHPFSAGNAFWRTGTKEIRVVDTVFCGCYRREVFDKIGLFNERLIRTQDKEFNARLVKSGGKIILDPSVSCTYYPRTKLGEYARWIYTGAKWLFFARRMTDIQMTSWRNYIPLCFLLYHLSIFVFIFEISNISRLAILAPLLLYFMLSLYFSINISLTHKRLVYIPFLLLIFWITHYSYGVGSIVGLFKSKICGRN